MVSREIIPKWPQDSGYIVKYYNLPRLYGKVCEHVRTLPTIFEWNMMLLRCFAPILERTVCTWQLLPINIC